jgi:ATP-dependent RNA helicase DDX27
MAPSKRKTPDDDFVFTLSDGDESLNGDAPATSKRAKIQEDDDEMDPDFELLLNDGTETADLDSWDFGGAAKGADAAPAQSACDIDDIIRRRKAKNGGETAKEGEGVDDEEEDDDGDESLDGVDLDDDEDEVLADGAFGMAIDGEVEADESQNEVDEAASDDDSVATPVNHPDDASHSSEEEDAEEEARKEAFFAADDTPQVSRKPGASSFLKLSLSRPILRGLNSLGFSTPTPIQAKAIPIALEGKDLVGGAVTGSGKTAAFMVPILERLFYRPNKIPTTRVVVLTPTRELAIQCHSVATKLASYTDIKITLAVGGLSVKAQELELKLRPDIIIATPGRFIDHMRNSQSFAVDTVEIVVLDEADRMLEDGFADELNEILATLPKKRQTMLFSATMTSSVDRLIRAGLHLPVRVMVDEQKKTVKTLVQEFVRLRPGREDKRMGYLVYICRNLYANRVLIFFRQKKTAHIARIVFGLMGLSCAELHGSMNQTQVRSINPSISSPRATPKGNC